MNLSHFLVTLHEPESFFDDPPWTWITPEFT
jgi:hypothetical protein